MATAYQSQQIAAGKQPRVLPEGQVISQINTFLNSVAFVINDTVDMVQLEANASQNANGPTISTVKVGMPAMDSSTGFTWTAGDSTTANKYISTSTTGQSGAGGVVSLNQVGGFGYQPFNASFSSYPTTSLSLYTVRVKVTAAASGTPTTGNTITMEVAYTYDP